MYKYPFYLLKKQRFLPFFVTQFFSALNDNVFKLSVLTLIAFHLTTNISDNQFYQAIGAGLFSLPFFLFSATAGQLADKYEKTLLIRGIKVIEVVLMMFGAVAIYKENIFLMLTLIFFMGVHSAFFGPLKYAMLPEHLKKKEWLAGNAFVEAGTFMAILIGVLAGSLLIPKNAIFLEQGLFLTICVVLGIALCGAISSFFIPRTLAANPTLVLKIHANIFSDIVSIMRESRKYPFVFPAIIGISWFWFVGATFLTEFPAYVQYTLHAEKNVFTLFLVLFTLGIAIGSLLSNRWLKGRIDTDNISKHVFCAILGMSFFTLDVYFQSPLANHFLSHIQNYRISMDFFLLAICGGIYIVPLYAIIQKYSPYICRSRMIAANNIMNALFMVFSAMWIGILAHFQISIPAIFLSLAGFNLFFAFYLLCLSSKKRVHTVIALILKGLYRVKMTGQKHFSERTFIILNDTSLLDYILLAVFLPNTQTLFIITDRKLSCYFSTFFTIKTNTVQKILSENRLQNITILPIQIKGSLLLPFSDMKGKVPQRWFPKIKLIIHPAVILPVTIFESKFLKKRNHLLFDSLPWKRALFDAVLDMYKIHEGFYKIFSGKRRIIASDAQQNKVTYADIVTRSFILGSLMAKNTEQGEYVGVLLPTMVNSMICFLGLQAFGRIPAMLNFSIGSCRLKSMCLLANIKTVYTSHTFIAQAKIDDLIQALLELNITIIYLEDYRKKVTQTDKIKGFLCGFFARWFSFHRSIKSTHPAVVLFTSGSEGNPKGVVLSHQNLLANAYQISTGIQVTTQDCLFNALPIFHCFGLTGGIVLPLTHGFSVFCYPSPLHYRQIPQWVEKTKATIFLATDTFLKGYAHYAQARHFDTVRCIFAGAEKIKEETIKKWEGFLKTVIFEGYGVTEAAPVIAVNTMQQRKIGTVGCLLPGIRYRLAPFEDLKEGGRLFVAGPNLMMGYLQADKPGVIVSLSESDEWYDTGDIASVDSEGYLSLLGRAKRFAKIGGEMVSFALVENAITTFWPDHLHAVLSVSDKRKGEQLILLTDCQEAKRERLIGLMKAYGYPKLFIPKHIQILSEIPILGSGKIDYATLEKYVINI